MTQIAAERAEFAPPEQRGMGRALVLALLAHGLLLLALTFSVQWKRDAQDLGVEAELWSAIPQQAAPRAVEPPPPPPPPAEPDTSSPPKPQAVQAPPKVQPPDDSARDAEIALAKEKERKRQEQEKLEQQAKLEKERQEKLKQQQAEREKAQRKQAEKVAADKAAAEKAAAEKKKQEQQRAKDEERKKQEAAEAAEAKRKADAEAKKKKDAAEAAAEAKQRAANIARSLGMAGSTGAPSATGNAQQSSGPSASYGGRVRAKVKPNIVFTDDVVGNPTAEVEVRVAPDGTIVGRKLSKSSGSAAWDDAVLKAIDKTEVLPRDTDGRVPSSLIISFRPKD